MNHKVIEIELRSGMLLDLRLELKLEGQKA
jgi:hypothetical protein